MSRSTILIASIGTFLILASILVAVVGIPSPKSSETLYWEAWENEADGDIEEALNKLTILIKREPENAKRYHDRGSVNLKIGQYRAALEDFARAIRLDPDYAKTHSKRAELYYLTGQYKKSIVCANAALKISPGYLHTGLIRGLSRTALGEFERGDIDFEWLEDEDFAASKRIRIWAYSERARIFETLGETEKAEEYNLMAENVTSWDESQ